MKLATNKRAVGLIIGALIAVIITVIFVTAVGDFVYNATSNIPIATGAIIDPAKVVCFGGGEDDKVHCLEKTTGLELFSFEKARAWEGPANSTPDLTKDGIFFAIGNRVCAYDLVGKSMWQDCLSLDNTIPTNLVANDKYVCFGAGDDQSIYCLDKKTGAIVQRLVMPDTIFESVRASSTPVLEGEDIYYGITTKFRKQNINKIEYDWQQLKYNVVIATDLVVDDKYVCYGGNSHIMGGKSKDYTQVYCYDKTTGTLAFNSSKVEDEVILSTPAINGTDLYYAIGPRLYEFNISSNISSLIYIERTESKLEENNKFTKSKGIVTDLALTNDTLCFGSSPKLDGTGRVVCLNLSVSDINLISRNNVLLSIDAPGLKVWDENAAESKPYLDGNSVFFGLGDKFCSYNFTNVDKIAPSNSNWCIDFDYLIPTGVAGYDK